MTDLTYYINPANVKQHLETKEYFLPIGPDWHLYCSNKVVSQQKFLTCINRVCTIKNQQLQPPNKTPLSPFQGKMSSNMGSDEIVTYNIETILCFPT